MENIMTKDKIIKELESFIFDYQYYLEKAKEIEKIKEQTKMSMNRLKELKENNLPTECLDNSIVQIMQKQADEEEMLLAILNKKQKIEKFIQGVEQPHRNILYLKYVRFYTFDQIAGKMNYSTKRIYQLHSSAIDKFCIAYLQPEKNNNELSLE